MSGSMKYWNAIPAIAACGMLLFAAGCGGGSNSTNVITTSAANVQPISVSLGPTDNNANGAFTSVTVCVPGTSTCQTIDGILVDTGSWGLRILSSLLTISLPQQNASTGASVVECFPFANGYTWGPVLTADVEMASEKASSTPVQAIGTNYAVPSGCLSFGLPPSNSLDTLGANGILGVGLFAQDCGTPSCPASANLYYQCPSSGCTSITQPSAQQVLNPVSLFATDNNGVIVELPAASGPEPSLSGSLVFGIGTQSNNGLSGAKVYTTDASGNFTTTFNGGSYSGSFLDSGSNGYFFPDASISICASNSTAPGFYCPTSTVSLSASNTGANGASGTVNFSIADAETTLNTTDSVYPDLGGPASGFFDWGLPFFFGRNVVVALDGAGTPGGTGPYWAY